MTQTLTEYLAETYNGLALSSLMQLPHDEDGTPKGTGRFHYEFLATNNRCEKPFKIRLTPKQIESAKASRIAIWDQTQGMVGLPELTERAWNLIVLNMGDLRAMTEEKTGGPSMYIAPVSAEAFRKEIENSRDLES